MTAKRIVFLRELLSFIGVVERIHLAWISSAEAGKFVQVVTEFTEKIRAMGSSPVKEYNSLKALLPFPKGDGGISPRLDL